MEPKLSEFEREEDMRYSLIITMILFNILIVVAGCGGGSSGGGGGVTPVGQADLAVVTRIDDTTGFITLVNGAVDTGVSNANGMETHPSAGLFSYNGHLYTTGSMNDDQLIMYAVNSDNSLTKVAETTVYEGGGSIPTNITFVNDTKAYLELPGVGQLVVFNPQDLTILNRIDLSAYAMDADGEFGGDDINPEPSGGIIRDGKFYLALGQFDTFSSWRCRGKASLLIIDTATDEILKHISDDRTCTSGITSPNPGLVLDENGDIYVVNSASYGYYPGTNAGILRINNGEDDFDPDYYFSITDLNDLDVPGGMASYAYNNIYLSNGDLYTTLFIPGLTSNPPDYVNDKNFVPYVLNLWDQTATKLDMEASNGWSTHLVKYNDEVVYGLTTANGTGLYYANENMPFVTLEGNPFTMVCLK
jgi:hypothetical protein